MFAGMDDQGMVLVEEGGAGGEVALEEGANFLVRFFAPGKMVSLKDAPGVSVHDKDRMFPGVEQDGIGGFGADAVNGEKLFPEGGCGSAKHSVQRTMVNVTQ